MAPTPSHTIGFPRIGDKRQMKVALERYWKKQGSYEELLSVSSATEAAAWRAQAAAGISRIGLDGTLYDQLLDTTTWLGVIPARFQGLSGAARYFAMARGAEGGCTALDMSKLFDTNYHYLVPELEDNFSVNPDFSAILDKVKRGQETVGVAAAVPMIIGPLTFVSLARGPAAADIPSAVRKVLPAYVALLHKLRELQVPEVQLHEPAFCTSAGAGLGEIATEAFRTLAGAYATPDDAATASSSPELHLVTFYDDVGECYPWLVTLPVAAITLDFLGVPGSSSANRSLELLTQHGFPTNKRLGAGIVDGRSVWADEAGVGAALLAAIRAAGVSNISITSSAPLQHLPYDVELETNLDSALRTRLGFAVQKLQDIATLASLSPTTSAAAAAAELGLMYAPKDATTAVDVSLLRRPEGFGTRRAKQLQFRPLPTTTIGSFPQTAEVRRLRLQYKQGRVSEAVYREELRGHIAYAIGVQEGLDIDVLVHGEAERTDMVEYFGQSLEGMLFTEHGWVQSYGSRYVRPPLVVADVRYRGPMTTREFQIAQSLTVRPVKGMLTGPVTILNWSFPRKDISRAAQAQQLAHALRQEVAALEAVGCRIVQVDEPALREGLPLKRERWDSYLKWAVDAFKLCTAIAAPATQIVTHLCYSDFADILHAIDAMDADVLTIENSRSGDEMLRALAAARYGRDIGPGVYDVHSPVVPSVDFVADKIRMFLASGILNGRADRIWVNPDCGLKTRGWEETIPSLRNMVAAAALVRAELAAGGAKAPALSSAGGGGAGGGGYSREVCACCI